MRLMLLTYLTKWEALYNRESHDVLNNHLGKVFVSPSTQPSCQRAFLNISTAPVLLSASREPCVVLAGSPRSLTGWRPRQRLCPHHQEVEAQSDQASYFHFYGLVTHLGTICFFFSLSVFSFLPLLGDSFSRCDVRTGKAWDDCSSG